MLKDPYLKEPSPVRPRLLLLTTPALLLATGCGGSHPPSNLSGASTCSHWLAASSGAKARYVRTKVSVSVPGVGVGNYFAVRDRVEQEITRSCQAASGKRLASVAAQQLADATGGSPSQAKQPTPASLSSASDFTANATTQEGDRVKVEGRFGSPLPTSQSDVDQSALAGCPPPAPDGRAVVVRLDLTTTLESNLAGEVGLDTGFVYARPVNFVMGNSQGAACEYGEPTNTKVSLGTLQPHQSANFTMWLVLPDAITPNDPQPSEQTLAAEHWLIAIPQPTVNGSGSSQNQRDSITGPRIIRCESESGGGKYLAVIAGTPSVVAQQNSTERAACP